MTTAWIEEVVQTKGDLPGHPFRGNQWSGGQGGNLNLTEEEKSALDGWFVGTHMGIRLGDESDPVNPDDNPAFKTALRKLPLVEEPIHRGVSMPNEQVNKLQAGKEFEYDGSKSFSTSGSFAKNWVVDRFETGKTPVVYTIDNPKSARDLRSVNPLQQEAVMPKGARVRILEVHDFGEYVSVSLEEVEGQKSPSRLAILHKLLDISTQAIRLKQLLLKDQLRNAVVKAVHLKQYAETEAELTEAMEGLIKRQYADAGRKLGRTKDVVDLIEKGDLPGHPFRGNQWSGVGGFATTYRSEQAKAELGRMFGHDLSDAEVASMVAAPSGTEVKVRLREQGDIGIRYVTNDIEVHCIVKKDPDGKLVMYNDGIDVQPGKQGEGIGTKFVKDQADNCAELGFDRIELYALGNKNYYGVNGYYTWPRLGFDGELPSKFSESASAVVPGATRLSDLMKSQEGRSWWKENGDSLGVQLSLGKDSLGRKVLNEYVAERAARQGGKSAGSGRWGRGDFGQDLGQNRTATKSPSEDIFDSRDWDDDLINTALPILMKKAGEAAAAQMLIMGVDVAPRKKVGRTEKGDLPGHPFRGNQWGGSGGVDLSANEHGKVVTDLGKPVQFYMGTESSVAEEATTGKTEFWLTSKPEVAQIYGSRQQQAYVRMNNPFELRQAIHDDELADWVQVARARGNDGLIARRVRDNGIEHITAVVFNPKQLQTEDEQKSPFFLSTKTTATEWLLENADVAGDLLWPEVFTLPSGALVDMGFATEWPDWMKVEISKQMKETFEQPFWAGINDTTAKGIQAHVEKGLLDGLSIREIRQQMVGDGLDEYYHNRGVNIARTESGNALNGARSAAMDRLAEEVPGLKVKRTWMSVLGTTTRDTHASLDGVPADRDGMWYLGGVRVPWPGHWNLPAGERCGCQCSIIQGWGMADEAASELIEEYNQRLNEERSLRDQLIEKGDKPGHPFRGNQWGQGRGGADSGSSDGYGATAAMDVLTGKQPPNAASAVRRIDQTSVKSDSPLKKGGVNKQRIVEIEEVDGTTGKYVFKPDDGENPGVHPAFRGHQSSNEVAASIVDEALGLDMVAKTEMVEIDGKKGSLQKWVNDDAKVADQLIEWKDDMVKDSSKADNAEGVADMLYFDALTGNHDRHINNWLVKDGKVKLIDNGMSMADNMEYGDISFRTLEHMPFAKRAFQAMTPKFKGAIDKLIASKEQTDAKLREAGIGAAQRQSFWKRAEYLRKAKSFGFGDSTLRDLGRLAEGKQLF